jgi:hypothetical protein
MWKDSVVFSTPRQSRETISTPFLATNAMMDDEETAGIVVFLALVQIAAF